MEASNFVFRPVSWPFTESNSAPSFLGSHAKTVIHSDTDRRIVPAVNSGVVESSLSIGRSQLEDAWVAWVRVSPDVNKNSERLSQIFVDEGLHVQMLEMDEALYDNLPRYDLILLESFGQVDANTLAAVSSIRMGSRAPLVMLMSSYARTEMIDALQAGVDAVWALGMPREMLLARCRALLRRWMPS